jgi:trans-2,3-dihydro-3-hydroxyanthranilate isomerase
LATLLRFYTTDVFTGKQFSGNPLAIVEDADNLSTQTMQTIAREFNLSETIFAQAPANRDHSARVRIFFPTAEIPFAGHPTIGCAIHLAQQANPGPEDFDTMITLEEVAGLVPVHVYRSGGKVEAQFTAPVIPDAYDAKIPSPTLAAAAVGLNPDDIGFDAHRIGLWEGGPAFLFIPVGSRDALSKSWPKEPEWSAMTKAAKVNAAYLYCPDGQDDAGDFHARMFAPASGIPEDPATGSASALLAAQLKTAGVLKEGLNVFRLRQGYDMGRPSKIGLEVDLRDNAISAVRISGSSVPVSSGTLELR